MTIWSKSRHYQVTGFFSDKDFFEANNFIKDKPRIHLLNYRTRKWTSPIGENITYDYKLSKYLKIGIKFRNYWISLTKRIQILKWWKFGSNLTKYSKSIFRSFFRLHTFKIKLHFYHKICTFYSNCIIYSIAWQKYIIFFLIKITKSG